MKKGKVFRLAGFVGALGVSAVLVTTAVQGTGAYFTDSVGGHLYASSGSLQITATGTSLNFSGLNPGQDTTLTIDYTNKGTSTTAADIWLVFNPTTTAYACFTGASTQNCSVGNDGGMGQYGHFKVAGAAGTFQSYNLAFEDASQETSLTGYTTTGTYADTNTTNTCNVNKWGLGGSAAQHHAANVDGNKYDIAMCGVPAAILLQHGLGIGDAGSVAITFGLTTKQTAQNQANNPNVPFQIVATQPNVRPGQAWGI